MAAEREESKIGFACQERSKVSGKEGIFGAECRGEPEGLGKKTIRK